jgi:hypothetical protein
MKKIIRYLIAGLVAMLIMLAYNLCLFVETLTRTAADMPVMVDKAIAREGMLTRAAASQQIASAAGKVDHQITALRQDLFTRVDTIETDTFHQVDQLRVDANQQISDTRVAVLAEVEKVLPRPETPSKASRVCFLPPNTSW